MPIEMNDYGCIVTSVCISAFIFLSVHVVKLEHLDMPGIAGERILQRNV